MSAFVTAGGGFLTAVLWMDLMFDVQCRGHGSELPEPVLASIAAYYARVTTAARPMNRLIAAVMAGTLAALIVEVVEGFGQAWVPWLSLALAACAILPAALLTVPSAVRLGARGDSPARQSELARSILTQHACSLACMLALVALQLAFS